MIFTLGEMAVLLFVWALVLWRFSDDREEGATPINSALLLVSMASGGCGICWIFEKIGG